MASQRALARAGQQRRRQQQEGPRQLGGAQRLGLRRRGGRQLAVQGAQVVLRRRPLAVQPPLHRALHHAFEPLGEEVVSSHFSFINILGDGGLVDGDGVSVVDGHREDAEQESAVGVAQQHSEGECAHRSHALGASQPRERAFAGDQHPHH
ncbi:Protein of unknown function, partial [Gryllus bimaculatus]